MKMKKHIPMVRAIWRSIEGKTEVQIQNWGTLLADKPVC